MKTLIKQYICDMTLSWAPSTLKSEEARLRRVGPFLHLDPRLVWEKLSHLKPYSRVTTWTRITAFYEWCIEEGKLEGPNQFKRFRRKRAKLFKHCYERKPSQVSAAEIRERLKTLPRHVEQKALQLLGSGLRWSESLTLKDGFVIGKGGKKRKVFGGNVSMGVQYGDLVSTNYGRLVRCLRKIGLKPHDLRKAFAQSLVEKGLNEFDLCHVMGWESLETAKSYVRAKKDEELQRLIQGEENA